MEGAGGRFDSSLSPPPTSFEASSSMQRLSGVQIELGGAGFIRILQTNAWRLNNSTIPSWIFLHEGASAEPLLFPVLSTPP